MTAQTAIDMPGIFWRESDRLPAFCHPGEPRWHALIVKPQREAAEEAILSRSGVYSFHPVTTRKVRIKGKQKVIVSRYLPGYVFARFPGPVIWHRLMASPLVADVVRHSSGWPAVLKPEDLSRIYAMRAMDEAETERQRQARRIRPGDRVRILSGAFEDEEQEVVEIGKDGLKIRMCIFGSEIPVHVAFDAVEKIIGLQHGSACGSQSGSVTL